MLTVSLFLPFYVSVAAVSAISIMTVFHFEKRAEAFREPYSKFIIIVLILTFFVGAVYTNRVGMVYSLLMTAAVISAFYLRSIMTRQLFNNMMDTACLAGTACVFVAAAQKLANLGINPGYRPVSTFSNANYFGMMMEFLMLIAMYRMFTNSQNKRLYYLAAGASLIGIYLSASVSSAAALGCGVLVMLFLKGKYRLAGTFLFLGLTVAAGAVIFPEIFPRVEIIGQSWEQRFSIWSTAFQGIERHPLFGEGPMTYQMIYDKYFGYKTYHSHNLMIDTILNFGFVGAGAICFYLVTQLKVLAARFRNNICGNMNILLLSAFITILVHGMTDVTIFWIQTGMLFLLMYSSTGIHSSYVSGRVHASRRLPILPDYGESAHAGAVYFKN